ncbi:MAG: NAD(P)/FAD-dependent oxidoreductase [Pseudomonadota bacterium]
MLKNKKIAIIGAGPAGVSCAIQLKRLGYDPLIFEKDIIGGLLNSANSVENYPGFHKPISGRILIDQFKKHLSRLKIKIIKEKIIVCNFKKDIFLIKSDINTYNCDKLVIASGTEAKKAAAIINENLDRVYNEVLPLLNKKNKKIVIIGASDAAFDYALSLQKNNEVIILGRSQKHKCLELLHDKVLKAKNAQYLNNTIIKQLSKKKTYLLLNCQNKSKTFSIKADYLLFAIGRKAKLDFLSKTLNETKSKLIKEKKLFLIGDVNNELYRQCAIAVGDGIKAAMEIDLNEGIC